MRNVGLAGAATQQRLTSEAILGPAINNRRVHGACLPSDVISSLSLVLMAGGAAWLLQPHMWQMAMADCVDGGPSVPVGNRFLVEGASALLVGGSARPLGGVASMMGDAGNLSRAGTMLVLKLRLPLVLVAVPTLPLSSSSSLRSSE